MFAALMVLLMAAAFADANPLNAQHQQMVLDLHNSYRRQLAQGTAKARNGNMATGANIRELKYDASLAQKAADWAAACKFQHPTNGGYGQNLAMVAPHQSVDNALQNALKMWWGEIKDYSGNSKFEWSSSTGHFTQVAWADTASVACAVQNCTNGAANGWSGFNDWTFTVCDYNTGNVMGQDLYKAGASCSLCPSGTSCHNSLCA